MAKQAFQKFIVQEEKGARKKEKIRQEKKKIRQETKEYFDKKKAEAKEARAANRAGTERDSNDAAYKRSSYFDRKARSAGKPKKESTDPVPQKPAAKKAAPAPATKPKTTPVKAAKPAPKPVEKEESKAGKTIMPLNKYIAHAGVSSRRDAAEIVKKGLIVVNGTVITEPGFKVSDKDEITYNGKKIMTRRNLVYILLNKPKDFITTTEDPQGRKTVLDLIKHATTERVYPIGRLDRNTTGVLLFTNDGELAQKLSHPSYQVRKIYEVKLDKPLTKHDFETILNGITLTDGTVSPDSLAYADSKDKSVIGIEIHSGKNRIVRRIFESLGYDVRGLDRVMYANLTKKNVERGKWRFLSEKEVRLLKFMNASYAKKAALK